MASSCATIRSSDLACRNLAILVTARFWTSHYEWFAHKREALRAGLEPEVIDAIAARKVPQIHDAKGQAVYAYAVMLHEKHVVSDEVHEAVVREFGERGVVSSSACLDTTRSSQ